MGRRTQAAVGRDARSERARRRHRRVRARVLHELDHYTGINYVFMLNERANQQTDPEEATADRLIARRVARQLLTIVETEIPTMPRDETGAVQHEKDRYWREATRVEALCVLDDPGSPKLATRVRQGAGALDETGHQRPAGGL